MGTIYQGDITMSALRLATFKRSSKLLLFFNTHTTHGDKSFFKIFLEC